MAMHGLRSCIFALFVSVVRPQFFRDACSQQGSTCDPGYFCAGSYDPTCYQCDAGGYEPLTSDWVAVVGPDSETYCELCAAGKYNSFVGATAEGECTSCQVGRYAGVAGSSACDACLGGRYAAVTGLSVCASCQPGAYSDDGEIT